jgi:valyl-tRNA synthetase
MEVSLLPYEPGIVSDAEKAFLESTANTTISFIDCAPSDPENYVANTVLNLGTFYMPRPKLDEAQRQAELTRINAELASIEKELARSTGKLSNESFVSKAPPEIIEKEKRIVAELTEKMQHLDDRKAALAG